MIATIQNDSEFDYHAWAFNKMETPQYSRRVLPSPRMSTSSFEAPFSAATNWQGQYSFLPPSEPVYSAQTFSHMNSSTDNGSGNAGRRSGAGSTSDSSGFSSDQQQHELPRPAALFHGEGSMANNTGLKVESGSPFGLGSRSVDPLGLRQSQPQTSHHQRLSTSSSLQSIDSYRQKVEDSTMGPEDSSLSSMLQLSDLATSHLGNGGIEGHADIKGEDDDNLIDEEDTGEPVESEAAVPLAQTAAERTAQRRKMKRFRLTHQQTRFLMSEFAKQPHPDATHREKLANQIPGLSPRQVQVWFQNRRAKIKRLAADDRDRVIKMRAVPDDFDNLQALHSQYGAVHGLSTSMPSPVDFHTSSYAEHMMRPLSVDVRRQDGDGRLSPTGLSPAFSNIGFNQSTAAAAMGGPDILAPLSPTAVSDHHQRYSSYSGHHHHISEVVTTSTVATVAMPPLSMSVGVGMGGGNGLRMPNPYVSGRHNSLDDGSLSIDTAGSNAGTDPHSPHSPESPQSTHHVHVHHQIRSLQPLQLREAMSRSRPESQQSPLRSSMSWKGNSLDFSNQSEGLGTSTTPTTLGYESSAYSGSTVPSPMNMGYPPAFPSPGLEQQQQVTSQSHNPSHLCTASVAQPLDIDLRPTVSATIAGFPASALLTGPIDFGSSRVPDYSLPQFSQAF